MRVPDSYHGREQAFVKHQLLKTYLERLFMIIGQSWNTIRYVDCFSGPWQEADKELQDTSIGISLEIMRKCREALLSMRKNVSFKALFIEKDVNSHKKLITYLNGHKHPDIETESINGEFYDLRDSILTWCGSHDFTFFFIDPNGWKKAIEIPTLEPLLKRPNSEFLINFMFDFLLRTHTQKSFRDDIQSIFGYTPGTDSMSPEEKEASLINLYRKNLKQILPAHGGRPRAVHVPILYPLRDRTLYHLVYLTRHAKGIEVFMAASEKSELIQSRVREQAKQENREARTKQLEIFPSDSHLQTEDDADLEEIKIYWLSKLSNNPKAFGVEELADMLEETGWFESDLQAVLGELIVEGKVANLNDETKRRRKKYIHFDANHNKGEFLIRIES